jgi:hypothetical protein
VSRQRLKQINRDRAALAAERHAKILKLGAEGKSRTEIAAELGIKPHTVSNIRGRSFEVAEEVRNEADQELRALKDFVLQSEEMTDKEIVDAVRGIWQDLTRLHGSNAPEKRVTINADAENLGPYRQFVLACRGLDEAQFQELLSVAREMPRKTFTAPGPPATSPLWLEDSNDATS